MKKYCFLSMLLLCSMIWTACKKSSSPAPVVVIPKGMFAKINNQPWTAFNSLVKARVGIVSSPSDYIEINAYDTTGATIDLRVQNFKTTGSFTTPQVNDTIFYSTDNGALLSPVLASPGNITIVSVNDSEITGTFSFIAGNVIVTNGTFDLNY